MNLEDRLRSHLHSGPDMIDDPSTTAADLTAAGNRRTQRNRVMVGGAAALTAFVLAGGALTLAGGGGVDQDNVATANDDASSVVEDAVEEDGLEEEEAQVDTFETDIVEDLDVDAADEGNEEASDSAPFDGPLPAFDSLVGVDNGFAGLRNSDGGTTALQSVDGLTFTEEPTTGIPTDATFIELIADEGTFAAIFADFGAQQLQQWIGTSENLIDWTLFEVDVAAGDLIDIDIEGGEVLVLTVGREGRLEIEDAGGEFGAEQGLLVGPIGGPYEPRPLPTGNINRVSASGDTLLVLIETEAGTSLLRSTAGREWETVSDVSSNGALFVLEEVDGDLFVSGFDGSTFESTDQGVTFTRVDEILATDASAALSGVVRTGDSTLALLVEAFDPELAPERTLYLRDPDGWSTFDIASAYEELGIGPEDFALPLAVNDQELLVQLFPADGGEPGADPTYLTISIG